MSALAELAAHLTPARSVVVITGAGISRASNIPTFRGDDPGAIWANDVLEKGTNAFFLADPVASWQWYHQRFSAASTAAPNPAHHALAALQAWKQGQGGSLSVLTQNVDTLHEQAGTQPLIKVHGSADRVRCSATCVHGAPQGSIARSSVDFTAFLADPILVNLPRCPLCDSLLRPHVLWFDEYYTGHADYGIHAAMTAIKRAEVLVFVGTSFSVGITESALSTALQRGRPVVSIDPTARPPHRPIDWVPLPAEVALPLLVEAVGAD